MSEQEPPQSTSFSAEDAATLRQSGESLASSRDLSTAHVGRQSSSAPLARGYALDRLIGEGAYGQVWQATQTRTRKPVAVKVFVQRRGLDWLFLQREVERLTRLDRHPHIVTLLDTDLASDPPFYAMDLIEGGSLLEFVKTGSPPSIERLLRWTEQICDALAYVHAKGLIHCDLKPANILLDSQDHVRVVDFGQSRVFSESSESLGTLYYMAPEQATLAQPGKPVQPDVRWDVYGVGATLFATMAGRAPHSTSEHDRRLGASDDLDHRLDAYRDIVSRTDSPLIDASMQKRWGYELCAIVDKCLSADPQRRYENIAAVQADVDALRQHRPVSPLAGRKTYRARKFVRRNGLLMGLATALIVLCASLFLVGLKQSALDRVAAGDIAREFVYEPRAALDSLANAPPRVRKHLVALSEKWILSPAFTERIQGARIALLVNPEAFWRSVDDGPLWRYGEWLEVNHVPWPDLNLISSILADRVRRGTQHQKYVALCLIGQLFGDGNASHADDQLRDVCVDAARNESWPGVVMAARWAAKRLGLVPPLTSDDRVRVDDATGLTFVRLPSATAFRRGSDPDERDRYFDEDRPDNGVAIAPVFVSTTEVTLSAVADFVESMGGQFAIDFDRANLIRGDMKFFPESEWPIHPARWMTLNDARKFCAWLTARSAATNTPRTYRLLTEDEWEYACRGGNAGRFCFGDNAEYFAFFGNCAGRVDRQVVALRAPNWYGLFDMHGGMWEFCSTRYPPEFADPVSSAQGELFAMRGGAIYSPAERCRSAQRNYTTEDYLDTAGHVGFRLVMESKTP